MRWSSTSKSQTSTASTKKHITTPPPRQRQIAFLPGILFITHRRPITSVLPSSLVSAATQFHINPTGRFVTGGPQADCGLTGSKIIADTYGCVGRHGGGAFSGKDASKVDRSASYMCRRVAKHIVAAGLAKHCEVQVSYAIGKAEPVSLEVLSDCKALTANKLTRRAKDAFSFKPADIIEALGPKNPIFSATTNYGHFGKANLPWEQINSERIIMLQKG